MPNITNIIRNLGSRLDYVRNGNNDPVVTFTKHGIRFFRTEESQILLISLSSPVSDTADPKRVKEIKDYIEERLAPSSNFRDAKLRFYKLILANELWELLRNPRENFSQSIKNLYDQALKLEHISLDGEPFASGKLGDLLFSLRDEPEFKQAYKQAHHRAASNMALAPAC